MSPEIASDRSWKHTVRTAGGFAYGLHFSHPADATFRSFTADPLIACAISCYAGEFGSSSAISPGKLRSSGAVRKC
jgi:hypothetical protein